jgi:hypothetical protein
MWFEKLTGFKEESPQQVQQNLVVEGNLLTSTLNGRSFICGYLEMPRLSELRKRVLSAQLDMGKLSVCEVVANVQDLHCDPANKDSLFQVASQFNLLEMTSPTATPELGVGIYEHDHTQGPACAVAAGAGTIYRNYFVPLEGQRGQTSERQVNCLADIGSELDNRNNRLWKMSNGYALATESGLEEIAERLEQCNDKEVDTLRQLLRIGLHWDTEVTLKECGHTVSQAYCSAFPVAYSEHSTHLWEPFARLILEASYEATICAAILNHARTGNNRVYLTLVGGGVFGNRTEWIIDAIERSLNLYSHIGLDVVLVSYGQTSPPVQDLIRRF